MALALVMIFHCVEEMGVGAGHIFPERIALLFTAAGHNPDICPSSVSQTTVINLQAL